ncbi:MAG: AmmeMemoRadiSam system protein B [Anaerolineales bacterium]|nr:AmmeMemoRadiSam system protein B [Anaerolineales bacterium]
MRNSILSGEWYPGEPRILKQMIDSYIKRADPPPISRKIIGIISPHAGYRFSGQTAAYGYKAVSKLSPDLVVILTPLHSYHPGAFLVSNYLYYRTPFGDVPVNMDALESVHDNLVKDGGEGLTRVRDDKEHSLEIQLPFLQYIFDHDFTIFPIMIRDQSLLAAQRLAQAIHESIKVFYPLFIASTDLSHFFTGDTASKMDNHMISLFEEMSAEKVLDAQRDGTGQACGAAAVAATLLLSQKCGGKYVQVLDYRTSGDVTGDYSSVVGYTSALILK